MGSKTQPARGMRDFLPADVRRRDYVIGIIKEVYERYGFEPLETPAVENIETLMGKYGEEGNQLIYKILKRGEHEKTGEADLALRYDLTVPLARVVAQYQNELPKFFKRYQIQPVWRADRPSRGRFREFYQCDVDILGTRSIVVETELIAAASDVLRALGFEDFTIRLNHRKILTAILDASGISPELHTSALTALDKFEKIGAPAVAEELTRRGISQESGVKLFKFLLGAVSRSAQLLRAASEDLNAAVTQLEGAKTQREVQLIDSRLGLIDPNEAILDRIEGYAPPNKETEVAIREMRQLLDLIKQTSGERVLFDITLARGLSYYTGSIIEISVPDLAGSLAGGGRYDNLVGMFVGTEVPACGISLGLERIITVMTERDMFPPGLIGSPADIMVSIWPHKDKDERLQSAKDSLLLAQELRGSGLRVDVYPVRNVKLGTQMAYASKRGIPFVAVIGEDERVRGLVTLKNMQSGEQQTIGRGEVVRQVKGSF